MSGLAEIIVRDLRFHYTPGVEVLRGITLTVTPGAVAIIGQNGAGKSTFVRLLNGLLKPTGGGPGGRGLHPLHHRRHHGPEGGAGLPEPHGPALQEPGAGRGHVRPPQPGAEPKEARRVAEAALARVGLTGVEEQNPYDLGLAERKLVTIAGVLAMDTPVVILDEPTIAQDVNGVRQIGEIVTWLQAQGRTVITITHDMDFVGAVLPAGPGVPGRAGAGRRHRAGDLRPARPAAAGRPGAAADHRAGAGAGPPRPAPHRGGVRGAVRARGVGKHRREQGSRIRSETRARDRDKRLGR